MATKPAASSEEVQQLKDLVSTQQKQMADEHQQVEQLKSQLQQLVDATQQANAAAQKAQSTTEQAQSTATQAQKDAAGAQRLADQASENAVEAKTGLSLLKTSEADNVKRLGTLEGLTSRFHFNGDIRLRVENFQQSCAACVDRNRARARVRLAWKESWATISPAASHLPPARWAIRPPPTKPSPIFSIARPLASTAVTSHTSRLLTNGCS